MWLTMIVVHAVAGTAAFGVGVAAIHPDRARERPWLLTAFVGLNVAMTLFVAGAVASHWSSLEDVTRAVFVGLVGLAMFMVGRAGHAVFLSRVEPHPDPLGHVDDVGFVLISLFDGFVIVAAIDVGLPPWLVVPIAVLGVVLGRRSVDDVKEDVIRSYGPTSAVRVNPRSTRGW